MRVWLFLLVFAMMVLAAFAYLAIRVYFEETRMARTARKQWKEEREKWYRER